VLESEYQKKLIDKLRVLYPGCLILKNDPEYLPGIPDLSIFYGARWAMLEVKASAKSKYRPNQEYYLELANGMSFASVIYPSIEEDVLSALSAAFQGV
jgi:hypothetical protein